MARAIDDCMILQAIADQLNADAHTTGSGKPFTPVYDGWRISSVTHDTNDDEAEFGQDYPKWKTLATFFYSICLIISLYVFTPVELRQACVLPGMKTSHACFIMGSFPIGTECRMVFAGKRTVLRITYDDEGKVTEKELFYIVNNIWVDSEGYRAK